MAKNAAISLSDYRAELPHQAIELLGAIRDWNNVQLAIEEDTIWLKGFTEEQAIAAEIRQLPGLVLYTLRDGLLFRKDALVPAKKMRSALLWSPLEKALRLSWPSFNHNYFGIHEQVAVQLVQRDEEQTAFALSAPLKEIRSTILHTPKFKLDLLQWTLAGDRALILGTPLLAFPGQTYWKRDGHLLPSGLDFEFKNMSPLLQQKYNPDQSNWLLWHTDGSYLAIPKTMIKKLSLSSLRLTENIY